MVFGLGSCMKAYSNDPNSAANSAGNALNANTYRSFDWSGTGPMSATISYSDGTSVNWVADASSFVYNYSGGYNILEGSQSGKKILGIWLGSIYPQNKYHFGLANGSQYIRYSDSASVPDNYVYWSLNAPLNSGGVFVITSDTFLAGTPGYITGLFYGEAKDAVGRIVSVSNGYFNYRKW
jgi:hypothetical protein